MFISTCLGIAVFLAISTRATQNDYQVAICAVQKNEGNYIYDWLTFHHYIGVSHFMIFDNNSTDNSVSIIKKWANQTNDVWLMIDQIHSEHGVLQSDLYQRCIERWRGHPIWIAFIDLDEMIVPMRRNSLIRALNPYRSKSAVFVSSKVMCDYGGNKEDLTDLSYIERFTNYAWTNRTEYVQGKVIVNANHSALDYCRFGTYDPERENRWRLMHNCFWTKDPSNRHQTKIVRNRSIPVESMAYNDQGKPVHHPYVDLDLNTMKVNPSYRELQLNHYKYRSNSECLQKIQRGYTWYQVRYGLYENWPQFAKEKTNPKYCSMMKRKGHCLSNNSIRAKNLWNKAIRTG